MIDRSEMFTTLLDADPTFEPQWRSFVTDYADQSELPLYIALGDFAKHLINRHQRGETEGFDKVFGVVERWHTEGDTYVREAASIGFLEGLQNLLGGNDRGRNVGGVRASDFEPYLGPETRRWWDKLYRFWEGDTAALRFDT
jgi:hypothetical protein